MRTTTHRVPDSAEVLIRSMAALPPGSPERAAARERVIEAWLPLARHLAARYNGRGEPADDLLQTATVGLIKSVDRWDAERGVEFSGFAIPTILGEVKRHFRDRTWSVRVPRRMQEMRMAITDANTVLLHTLGRSPTVADVAVHLGLTEEEVLEGLEGARAYAATSLSTPVSADQSMELGDTLGTNEDGYEAAELHMVLGDALQTLDDREQKILSMRFYGNQTQTEIASQIGISQMHVSRLITRALAKLRQEISAD